MTIGALLIILNLASEPFVQQLVVFQPQMALYDDTSASLPRASSYSKSDIEEPTFPMKASIYA